MRPLNVKWSQEVILAQKQWDEVVNKSNSIPVFGPFGDVYKPKIAGTAPVFCVYFVLEVGIFLVGVHFGYVFSCPH